MRFLLTILFLALFSPIKAPSIKVAYLTVSESVNPFEPICDAIGQVESSGDHLAIGDTNLLLWSYGRWQVRQSRLDDYYEQTGIYYRAEEMIDTIKAKQVFMYYASQFDYWDVERISRCWNGGKNGMSYKSTINYWNKVKINLDISE